MFAVADCGGYLLLRTATLSDRCIEGHLDVLLHHQSAGAFQVIAWHSSARFASETANHQAAHASQPNSPC